MANVTQTYSSQMKFTAIVKALGFSIEKKTELQRSIEDVESGRVIKCSSLEELINTVS